MTGKIREEPFRTRHSGIWRLSCLLLCLAIIAAGSVFSSCQADPAQTTPSSLAETRTITDCNGRSVAIPDHPARIVCLYAATAHLMALFNAEGLIVGAPEGVLRDMLMAYKRPDIQSLAVPFQDGSINIEELARIDADLALVRRSTAQNPAEAEKLAKLGIPYVVVDFLTISELQTAVTVMGNVLDQTERADNILAFFSQTFSLVEKRLQGLNENSKPAVYHAVNEAARTDQAGDICAEITRLAGVVNVSTDAELTGSEDKHYTTLEQIYSWNPDYILANDYAAADYMLADSKWQGLQAVRMKQVITLPVGISRWCHPGSIEPEMAVLFIAWRFYPDRFADFDLSGYIQDYYHRFFGLDLDHDMVQQVLSGRGMRLQKEG